MSTDTIDITPREAGEMFARFLKRPSPSVPWCTCGAGRTHGFVQSEDEPGLWVHTECGKPTKMFLEAFREKQAQAATSRTRKTTRKR